MKKIDPFNVLTVLVLAALFIGLSFAVGGLF